MSGVDDLGWQGVGQNSDKVGAVHPERRIPARGVRHLDRCDQSPVVAEVARTGADPSSPFGHRRAQSYPLQLTHAVGSQENPGSNLAKSGSLFKDRHSNTMRNQSVRSEETADTSAHDHDVGPFAAHHQLLALTAPKYSGHIVVSSKRMTQSHPHKGRPSERRTSEEHFA